MSAWRQNATSNSYTDRILEEDEDGYTLGAVVREGKSWVWCISSHCEGRNEPATVAEGPCDSMEDGKAKLDAYWKAKPKGDPR